jgi:OPA family sugar phosphate sensor protein UhpC-like MFS transporter
MFDWFRSGPDAPRRDLTSEEVQTSYFRNQVRVAFGLVVGYSFFYTTRIGLSVVKGPLLKEGFMTKEEVGMMGSALLVTYAFGKFTNGFLADHANIRKFMSFGLGCSALINLALGSSRVAWVFILLWGLNGWFQSMGSAPSCVSIYQWFPVKTRGTVYSVWAGSHNIGEGITFALLPMAVTAYGWRAGFWAPALASLGVTAMMLLLLRDRPETLGLPPPVEAFEEAERPQEEKKAPKGSTLDSQFVVLRSKTVWIIALACAGMYISRYAVNSWAILYLQEARGYGLEEAGKAMVAYPVMGLLGAVFSGWISDFFFRAHRPAPATLYGLCNVGGMALLFYGPGSKLIDAIAMGIFGFGIGGLVVFLAGLMAADLMPKKAVGATKGFIGLLAYMGAAGGEYLSSVLIKVTEVGGHKVYDFSLAIHFWIASGVVSMVLVLLVWNAKPVELEG